MKWFQKFFESRIVKLEDFYETKIKERLENNHFEKTSKIEPISLLRNQLLRMINLMNYY